MESALAITSNPLAQSEARSFGWVHGESAVQVSEGALLRSGVEESRRHSPTLLFGLPSILTQALTREQLLSGLFLLAFANGALLRAFEAVDIAGPAYGWTGAAMNTFGISVIVWAAIWIALRYIVQGRQTPFRLADGLVSLAVIALTLVPSSVPAWLAMTGLALYLAYTSEADSYQKRGAWILLAITVPMCWSRIFFACVSDAILEVEAILVGMAMGTPRVGNMVQFADGSGYMQIWPACSSFSNVSLTLLCWVTFCQVHGSRASVRGAGWCLLACIVVVLINVSRISLIGFYPEQYDLLHGPVGMSVAGWLTLGASVAICAIGVRAGQKVAPLRTAHA